MSDGDFKKDKFFGDSILTEAKIIMCLFLGRDDMIIEDNERNADLIIFTVNGVRIGVRARRYKYLMKYPDEFTIRFKRETGVETEFDKIMEGWGDYFFYCFEDEREEHVVRWLIGDYNVFRAFIKKQIKGDWNGFVKVHTKINNDGIGSEFLHFKANEIPGFVIRTSEDEWWKETKKKMKEMTCFN